MDDLIIVGGGPAGLSAALNAAAEGLSVTLLERSEHLGGQAGTSSRIENYLGFSNGVSGEELTVKAKRQAQRLGARLMTGHPVQSLSYNDATGLWVVGTGTELHPARAVLLATGVDYRRLRVPGGNGPTVFYGAPAGQHEDCRGKDVVVIGGGNSAGQAALNLAHHGARVTLLVRSPLMSSMSQYLIERIATEPAILPVIGNTERIEDGKVYVDDGHAPIPAECTFVYIGSEPRTDFLDGLCEVDEQGFVRDMHFMANTNGLFVAGDVRSGSAKRVAVAAGEGAISAAGVWRHLHHINETTRPKVAA